MTRSIQIWTMKYARKNDHILITSSIYFCMKMNECVSGIMYPGSCRNCVFPSITHCAQQHSAALSSTQQCSAVLYCVIHFFEYEIQWRENRINNIAISLMVNGNHIFISVSLSIRKHYKCKWHQHYPANSI